jgi:SOS-response transcriptional repressor LexA
MSKLVEAASELIRTNPGLANEVARQLERKPIGGLTIRQRDVLNFILAHNKEHGVAPSIREIARGVGIKSPGRISVILRILAERDYITRLPGRARSIVVRGVSA